MSWEQQGTTLHRTDKKQSKDDHWLIRIFLPSSMKNLARTELQYIKNIHKDFFAEFSLNRCSNKKEKIQLSTWSSSLSVVYSFVDIT